MLGQGCLGELVIKVPARLTALAKPSSLLGLDSGFIGSRVEEAEARVNRSIGIVQDLCKKCVKMA
jgi:hypothetical protein